jgi:8-oxo-dGTP pyrophosphatase MutT (NUDIX family)|tara:strand:+ start:2192 stop:2569 length:378 start_codon:yes stop_codon:yes gene_type:complete
MRKSSGVLLICENTGNFLLLKRSKISYFPYSWSVVAGGIEENESPLNAAKRELTEETQIDSKYIRFEYFETQYDLGNPFPFYLGYCDEEYECVLDGENIDWGWFNMDNLPDRLFPTLYSSLVRIF